MNYSQVQFATAGLDSDQDLRTFLGSYPSDGRMRIGLAEEPSYFAAQLVRGSRAITLVGRDKSSKRIAAVGSIAFRDVYMNGCPASVGYLSSLRIHPDFRNGTLLARGFRQLDEARRGQSSHCYLTTILEDNHAARAILTSGRKGIPQYNDWGRYHTLAFSRTALDKGVLPCELTTSLLRAEDVPKWLAFLRHSGPKRQFFPQVPQAESLLLSEVWPGLRHENVHLAWVNGEIVGTMATWDQRAFRQWAVHGYTGVLRWARPGVNAWMRFRRMPPLPKPGEQLDYRFLSLICIDNDNPDIFITLFRNVLRTLASIRTVLLVGFHERDPLLSALGRIPAFRFRSRLYQVVWAGETGISELSAGVVPYLDVGTL